MLVIPGRVKDANPEVSKLCGKRFRVGANARPGMTLAPHRATCAETASQRPFCLAQQSV